ncbi:AAA family ATPase [Actinomadura alba]|uniref:AAA family ATPase n=2 Tax=Actinomadura alba TaxID=406431 RepID=A0ABR7LLG9_9ACTN|nr:AAA family ATPase [Actinomadura alba]
MLIGRSPELQRLGEALARAPSAVLVGGEAGVGKTRLIREFGDRAQSAGARVLLGACLELGADGLPFAPFTTVLRGLVREMGADGVTALLPDSAASGLARLLPDFGEPEPDATSGEARARLFEVVLTLLEGLAEDTPTVLVIEDAHWADRSTRDLLTFLIRNLDGAAALLLVVTYRSDELHRSHPLRPLLAGLERVDRVDRVELSRLSRREVADLVHGILDHEPSAQLVEQVYTRSEGNPLFVEVLLNSEDGGPAGELPESLRDLLLAGVRRLPEDAQELLRVASGGGDHIEHALLAAVSGLDAAALDRTLRPAVAANVLVVEGDRYAFRHALIREAVQDDLLPGEHSRLHARYAEALEGNPTLLPARRLAVELAHHWYRSHDATWALISAWRAAGEARKAAAYAEALEMFSRVLELWDRVPGAAEHIGRELGEVLEDSVSAADLAGDGERGIKLATAALKEIGDPVRAAGLLEQRGRMSLSLNRAEGLEDLREAIRLIPARPPSVVRARALASLAEKTYKFAVSDEAGRIAEEAALAAREAGDAAAEVSALLTLIYLDEEADDEKMLARLDDVALLAERARSYRPVLRVAVNRSHLLEGMGRHQEAIEVARLGVEKARHHGLARVAGTGLAINLADPLVSVGRWDEALAVIEHTLEQGPAPNPRDYLRQLAAEIALARGDLDRADAALAAVSNPAARGAGPRAENHFYTARLEAELHLARGNPHEAISAVQPVIANPGLVDDGRYAWPALVAGARACTEARDADAFAAIEARAAGLAARGPVQRAHRLAFAAEAAEFRRTPSRSAWDAAADAWEALGHPYRLAWALTRAAEAAAAEGHRDGLAPRLRRAAELADGLAAHPLLKRIDEVSRRTRLNVTAGPADAAPLGLTPRELEVLRLVADGRSNRDIAETLFISVKTASVHVSNILSKLNVGARGEAAATAHRLRLFEPDTAQDRRRRVASGKTPATKQAPATGRGTTKTPHKT